MQKGTVKWFHKERGYDFITNEEWTDIFVHWSDIEGEVYRNLEAGQSVVYVIIENEKGKVATNAVVE